MSHIHTEHGQHDLTVSALIIRTDGPEPRAFLHLHKRLNMIMHIGGHVELDENPWQGLIRELREESGYDLSQLQLLQPAGVVPLNFSDAVAHPTPVALLTVAYQGEHSHYHTDICYAFLTEEEPAHAPADDESSDFRLLSRDEIADLREGEIPANIREIALTVMDDYSKTWQKVIPPAI